MWKGFSSFIFTLILISVLPTQAQETTPYSRFGFGLLSENNFITSRSMGGLGASFRSTENVNFSNPASYAHLNLISFEGGMSGSFNKISSENLGDGRTGNVNLSYLAFSIPVKKDLWVSSIGIVPFSQKSYSIADSTELSENNSIANIFEGTGTLYNIYWGNGFKYKDFSVGFNIGYLFGSIDATSITVPLDSEGFTDPYSFSVVQRDRLRASGLLWNVGAQYGIPIKESPFGENQTKKLRMDVGLSFNSSYNIGNKSSLESSKYSIYSIVLPSKNEKETFTDFIDNAIAITAAGEIAGSEGADIDTFLAPTTSNVTLRMPFSFNAGFTFVKSVRNIDFWKAGFDFKYTPWSNYGGYESSSNGGQLSDSWRIAFGGEIFPLGSGQTELKSKMFSQLKYRAGFYYSRTAITANNSPVDEFGINFGISIPVTLRLVSDEGFYGLRKIHPFTIAFEVGSRGTKSNSLIKDNFVRINLGISLNDKWFVKRKYN